jgi:hypothetical protein
MLHLRSSARRRPYVRSAALALLTLATLGATAAGPAQAKPLGRCDGPCPKLVSVYRSTYAYSTPYFNARRRQPLRPTTYIATCEAKSTSVGPYNNRWWTRLRSGVWVNNGYLRGGVKMGIGDCRAPRNDGPRPVATHPPAWSNGPVNARPWRPTKRSHRSISCGSRSIPAGLRPESVRRGWTARTQAIVNILRGPVFGWRSVTGAATGGRSGHVNNSYHYCGRAIDAFAPGVRQGTRATGAGLRASWRMANWAAHNAAALRVSQVIFYDRIWTADHGSWRRYTNPGGSGNTRQHRDHVHLSVY